LFLDEPTSGVDPLARRVFRARIGTLADAGVAILVTSHFMEEAEYCDRLGIIDGGHLIATATPPACASVCAAPNCQTPRWKTRSSPWWASKTRWWRHDRRYADATARAGAQGDEADPARSLRHPDRLFA
jgi:ABC-type multidrug transport system ATPase subunit